MEIQSTPSSMQFLLLEQVQFLKVKDESLLQWELVDVLDVLDAEEEVEGWKQVDDDIEGDGDRNWLAFWDKSIFGPVSCPNDAPIEAIQYRLFPPEDEHDHQIAVDLSFLDDDGDDDAVDDADGLGGRQVDDAVVGRQFDVADAVGLGGRQVDDDADDDEDDGYDLDDELVPWNVSNKFGRQRMRKLGKRRFSKMHYSKRSPCLFVRPGCVRGKHGLGLKHNY